MQRQQKTQKKTMPGTLTMPRSRRLTSMPEMQRLQLVKRMQKPPKTQRMQKMQKTQKMRRMPRIQRIKFAQKPKVEKECIIAKNSKAPNSAKKL